MRLVALLLVAAGCAVPPVTVRTLPTSHVASPNAPIGRLAGAPPSLRAGVVAYPDVPPLEAEQRRNHDHHEHH